MGLRDVQENLEKAVAPLVDGPLLAAMPASPAGSMGQVLVSKLFSAGNVLAGGSVVEGSARGRVESVDGKPIKMPSNFVVAVTAESVYFFTWKLFWGRVKIKKELARLSRHGLQAVVEHGKLATQFAVADTTQGRWTAFELGTLGMAKAKEAVETMERLLAPER